MVSSNRDNPMRQLAAAWEAATPVATEWADRTAAITAEAFHKLATDPAVRAEIADWADSARYLVNAAGVIVRSFRHGLLVNTGNSRVSILPNDGAPSPGGKSVCRVSTTRHGARG